MSSLRARVGRLEARRGGRPLNRTTFAERLAASRELVERVLAGEPVPPALEALAARVRQYAAMWGVLVAPDAGEGPP